MSTKFKQLDVRPLLARGEMPLDAIRAKLDGLKAGEGLLVVAPFLPAPLIELLRGEGFASRHEAGRAGEWKVFFWRDSSV